MKQLTSVYAFLLLFAYSCQKANAPVDIVETSKTSQIVERNCAADDLFQQQLKDDPSFRARVKEIEAFTQKMIQSGELQKGSGSTAAFITIPVVMHVVYNTPEENISDAQIQSQIEVLNEDFNLQNADTRKVPSHFESVKANVGIKFVLAQVIRKYTSKSSFGTNNAVKKSVLGGSDAVDPSRNLNFWSCNLGQNLLGYAQFPGGNPNTDGVVVLYSAVGSRAKFSRGTYVNNYDLGRTATHEVGHWMNLRHIWGDATCGNDNVGDTPLHNTYNVGCPKADERSTCVGTPLEMWMNYMDYTYDACMYMFSNGQKDRMLAVFSAGGPRAAFAN
jgi:hypothetical protein